MSPDMVHVPWGHTCSKNPNVHLHSLLALKCRPLPPTTSTAPLGVTQEPQAHHIQNPLPICLLDLPTPVKTNRSSSSPPHHQISPCKSCRLRSPSEHPEPGPANPSQPQGPITHSTSLPGPASSLPLVSKSSLPLVSKRLRICANSYSMNT